MVLLMMFIINKEKVECLRGLQFLRCAPFSINVCTTCTFNLQVPGIHMQGGQVFDDLAVCVGIYVVLQ